MQSLGSGPHFIDLGTFGGDAAFAVNVESETFDEGEQIDAGAFKVLVKAALAQNGPPAKKR